MVMMSMRSFRIPERDDTASHRWSLSLHIAVPKKLLKVEQWIYPHFVDATCAAQLKPLDAQLRRRSVKGESASPGGEACTG
jgi:hypothetical protein